MRDAFTMLEMVFVIVVLGILASIALPRLAATRADAEITKGRADIASIRSAIVTERQSRLIQGDSTWISGLSQDVNTLFDGNGSSTLLMYGITASNNSGHWSSTDATHYQYHVNSVDVNFTYDANDGTFTCDTGDGDSGATCQLLIN